MNVHDEDVEVLEQVPSLDGAAADGDHGRLAAPGRLAEEAGLDLAKRSLSLLLEELPDRPLRTLDLLVDIQERPTQAGCNLAAEHGLAGSHEADQREVAI
jgi:hypothetical protein